ncbi:potassium channel family protein [Agrococcus carbonis]|uniref:Trk system potassium uptake protein TrkA n=1 Tax=Agrococcus carbonis TaxID=684552 RepID=A0A1H1TBD6_9MICO|nr:TrkA family potassium uptake protein [Agrococcus carbonis]SDS57454.1 trk system potassium uptake protein TrkA [Agrococcus carbonis]
MARLRNPFDPRTIGSATSVAVIGLGRFGSALALELMANGTEVLGIDDREDAVQALNGRLTGVVAGDATQPELIEQLGLADFDRVVVAIGTDVTASILCTSQLLRVGVRQVWAKAVDERHAVILDQLGVTHVVRPEADMGRRVAHMVRGAVEDFIEIEPGYAAVRLEVPASLAAVPLRELNLQQQHGVGIGAVKREGAWVLANAETRFEAGDTMLVHGRTPKVEAFAVAMAKQRLQQA